MPEQRLELKQKQDANNALILDSIESSSSSSEPYEQNQKKDHFPSQQGKSLLTRSFSSPNNNHEVPRQINESDEEVYQLLKEQESINEPTSPQQVTQSQEMQSPIFIKIESYDQNGQIDGQPFYMLRQDLEVRQSGTEQSFQICAENEKSQTEIQEAVGNTQTVRKYFIEENEKEGQFYLQENKIKSLMYLVAFSKQCVLINSANIEDIFNFFIQNKTIIPIIHSQVFTASYRNQFWIAYFRFLVQIYRPIFLEAIKSVIKKKKVKREKKQTSKIERMFYESGAEMRDNLCSLLGLNFDNYSKSKILKNYCVSKLSLLKQFDCETFEMESHKKELHEELVVLEMTQSFENSFYFCEKNLRRQKQGNCETNWKEMKDTIEKVKKNWLREHSNPIIMI